jgi:3'-phosphoadenosine 5'-phosphosulfate sulfotransferase (PAPS reductase)/FAD synthetase
MQTATKRLTPAQRAALNAYEFALRQEDRYMGSVFVTIDGQRKQEAKTRAAYDACKALGMTYEHGL